MKNDAIYLILLYLLGKHGDATRCATIIVATLL